MNNFAGNLVFEGLLDEKKLDDLKYICHPTFLESGKTCLLVFGETDHSTSDELKKELSELAEVLSVDISISTEDRLSLLNKQIEGDVYEMVSFEGIEICYEELVERFGESYEAVAIREAETSLKFGNKVIKVDFIY